MAKKTINILFYVVAALYVFMMIDLFFRFSYIFDPDRIVSRSYNLIPFGTIREYIRSTGGIWKALTSINIAGNVIVFIPYGLYLSVMKKRKEFAKNLAIVAITSVAIEAIQFLFGLGACDIDDVILNTIGGIVGTLAYKLLRQTFKTEERTKSVIAVTSIVLGIPIIYLYFTTVFNHLRL